MDCLIMCVYGLHLWNLNLPFLDVKPNFIFYFDVVWHTMLVSNGISTSQPLHCHWTFFICLMQHNTSKVHTMMSERNKMLISFMFKSIVYFKWTIFRLVLLYVIDIFNKSKIGIPCVTIKARLISHVWWFLCLYMHTGLQVLFSHL